MKNIKVAELKKQLEKSFDHFEIWEANGKIEGNLLPRFENEDGENRCIGVFQNVNDESDIAEVRTGYDLESCEVKSYEIHTAKEWAEILGQDFDYFNDQSDGRFYEEDEKILIVEIAYKLLTAVDV